MHVVVVFGWRMLYIKEASWLYEFTGLTLSVGFPVAPRTVYVYVYLLMDVLHFIKICLHLVPSTAAMVVQVSSRSAVPIKAWIGMGGHNSSAILSRVSSSIVRKAGQLFETVSPLMLLKHIDARTVSCMLGWVVSRLWVWHNDV